MRTPFLCTLLLVSWAGQSSGVDRSWTGTVSSNWFDAGNWDPAGIPAPDDIVTVTKGNIVVPADVTMAGLNFNSGTIHTTNVITATHLVWGNTPTVSPFSRVSCAPLTMSR